MRVRVHVVIFNACGMSDIVSAACSAAFAPEFSHDGSPCFEVERYVAFHG